MADKQSKPKPTPNQGWKPIVLKDGLREIELKANGRNLKAICLASRSQVECSITAFVRDVLNEQLAGKKVTIIPILEGAMFVAVDILRLVTDAAEVRVRSVKASYYGEREVPGEKPLVLGEPFLENEFEDRFVVIVDDVHDSGITIAQIRSLLEKTKAEAVLVVVLVNKLGAKKHELPDYWIFEAESNVWLGGHGMDVNIDATSTQPKVIGVFRNYPGLFDKRTENYHNVWITKDKSLCRKFR